MIENRINKIALLNLIFHCNLDSIYNLIIKIESNLNEELYDNIEIDNLFKLNKELDIKIIISNSQKNITAISFFLTTFSCLENYFNRVKNLFDIKEKKIIEILNILQDKFSLINLNNQNWEKIHFFKNLRNHIIHNNENIDLDFTKVSLKIYKNNYLIINNFNEIELDLNFVKLFIKDIYNIFNIKSSIQ
jgi:hypothetical protein